jgi:quercetin dioxygenase-like cupin family protein
VSKEVPTGKPRVRNRTYPGKYTIGSWQSLAASDAQKIIDEEVIATQRVMVVRCGYKPGSDFKPHVHRREQLTIVESGTLEFVINGNTVAVGPGQMISIFPGVLHGTRTTGEKPVRALNIFYSCTDVPAALLAPTLARLSRAN